MSIDRVKEAQKTIQAQLQPGEELVGDLPPAEFDGCATFEVHVPSLERARALTIACREALGPFAPCEIEPARCISPGDRSLWTLVITIDVGGTRGL